MSRNCRAWFRATVPSRVPTGTMSGMTRGEQVLEEFRRQRRAGDPRITPEGREILLRLTTGDLADDFADSLAASSAADFDLD